MFVLVFILLLFKMFSTVVNGFMITYDDDIKQLTTNNIDIKTEIISLNQLEVSDENFVNPQSSIIVTSREDQQVASSIKISNRD